MAINPDNFILHSSLLFEQRVNKIGPVNVVVSGNIGASATGTYASDWYTFKKAGSTVRGRVYVPGAVYNPNVTNAEFPTPVSLLYDNVYNINFTARIEVENTRYRCVIIVDNPYDFVISSPGRTFAFTVREYLPA